MTEYISIFNPKLARKLLKNGETITDVKPFKENKDKTIFVFKKTESVCEEIRKFKE